MTKIFTKETIEAIKAVAKITLAVGTVTTVSYGLGYFNGLKTGMGAKIGLEAVVDSVIDSELKKKNAEESNDEITVENSEVID